MLPEGKSGTLLSRLFGRNSDTLGRDISDRAGQWEEDLTAIEGLGGGLCAEVFNIRNDGRVSDERLGDLSRTEGDTLLDQMRVYFDTEVRFARVPAFSPGEGKLEEHPNRANCYRPQEECQLIRIMAIDEMSKVLLFGAERAVAGDSRFHEFAGYAEHSDPHGWLGDKLTGLNAQPDQFLLTLLELLNVRAAEGYYFHPAWVCPWSHFKSIYDAHRDQPQYWLSALGITFDKPQWVFILRYPASRLNYLVRPSILDVNTRIWHHPSPEGKALVVAGGHPVSGASLGLPKLLPEYIHEMIDYLPGDLMPYNQATTGAGTGAVAFGEFTPVDDELEASPTAHAKLLRKAYPRQVSDWVPTPNCSCSACDVWREPAANAVSSL